MELDNPSGNELLRKIGDQRSIKNKSTCKRVLLFFFLVSSGFILLIYYRYFRRDSVEDILKYNKATDAKNFDYEYYGVDPADIDPKTLGPAGSHQLWRQWIAQNRNHFSEVGNLWDRCDVPEQNRITVGKTVLQADIINGGVSSRIVGNFSLNEDLTGGELHLNVKYNDKDLYSNYYDVCTIDKDVKEPQVICPIEKFKIHKYDKVVKVPNYLPKGKYSTSAYIVDQNGKTVGCGFCEFKL